MKNRNVRRFRASFGPAIPF